MPVLGVSASLGTITYVRFHEWWRNISPLMRKENLDETDAKASDQINGKIEFLRFPPSDPERWFMSNYRELG